MSGFDVYFPTLNRAGAVDRKPSAIPVLGVFPGQKLAPGAKLPAWSGMMEHTEATADNDARFATLKGTAKPATLTSEGQRELAHFRVLHEAADAGYVRDMERVLRKR